MTFLTCVTYVVNVFQLFSFIICFHIIAYVGLLDCSFLFLIEEFIMSSQDMAFLPSRSSFHRISN